MSSPFIQTPPSSSNTPGIIGGNAAAAANVRNGEASNAVGDGSSSSGPSATKSTSTSSVSDRSEPARMLTPPAPIGQIRLMPHATRDDVFTLTTAAPERKIPRLSSEAGSAPTTRTDSPVFSLQENSQSSVEGDSMQGSQTRGVNDGRSSVVGVASSVTPGTHTSITTPGSSSSLMPQRNTESVNFSYLRDSEGTPDTSSSAGKASSSSSTTAFHLSSSTQDEQHLNSSSPQTIGDQTPGASHRLDGAIIPPRATPGVNQGDERYSASALSLTQQPSMVPAGAQPANNAVVRSQPSGALVHNVNSSNTGNAGTTSQASAATVGMGQSSGPDSVIPMGSQKYIDITDLLTLPQSEAAKYLGVPTSTLSKRWKEAVRGRKWPYRTVTRIDKEILTLLHNIPQGSNSQQLPEEVEASLALLMKRRQEELKPVIIRL